jgi:hypothetical protein
MSKVELEEIRDLLRQAFVIQVNTLKKFEKALEALIAKKEDKI